MKSRLVGLSLVMAVLGCGSAQADVGMFSRANCAGFNESVSWDPIQSWMFATDSMQTNEITGEYRDFVADEALTGRSYAGCGFCGTEGWHVEGTHWAGTQDKERDNNYLRDHICETGWTPQSIANVIPCKRSEARTCNLTEW